MGVCTARSRHFHKEFYTIYTFYSTCLKGAGNGIIKMLKQLKISRGEKEMKKLIALMMTAALLITAGCGIMPSSNDKSTDGKTVLTVGGWPDKERKPTEYETYERKRKEFMEKYPDIVVERDTWSYTVDTFLPKAAANQLPTIFYLPFTEVAKVVDAGYVADITEYMEKYGFTENLSDNLLELVTRNGGIYSIPLSAYAFGISVNKAMFEKAGLVDENGAVKFPQTWDELGEMAGIIKEKTGKAGFIMPTMNNNGGWHFTNIAWAFGTEFMKQDENGKWKATFDSPECAAALKFISDLKWKYNALSDNLFIDLAEARTMLASGQGAMLLSAPSDSNLKNFVVNNGMDINDLSVGSVPAGPGGKYSLMGGSLNAISANATPEQIDAAFKWLEFSGNTANITDEALETFEASIKTKIENGEPVFERTIFNIWKGGNAYEKKNEILKKYATADLALCKEYMEAENVIIKPEEPVACQELYTILDNCIQEVIENKNADIEKILKDAAKEFQTNYLDGAN